MISEDISSEEFSAPVDELDQRLNKQQLQYKGGFKDKKRNKKPRFVAYAKRFQVPGWLVDIPQDFGNYMVTVKPDGKRTLLFISASKVVSRSKSGHTIHIFYSDFAGKSPIPTVLEAIYNERTTTYYIMDVIQWKGTYFTGESALFRQTWLASNMPACSEPTPSYDFRIRRIEYLPNTRKNV